MSIMMRPDSGTMSRTANHRDVNKHINELQQELTRSRAETQRARDKLNCLISLVRRSWNGDRNASIHLANIIGLDIPSSLLDSGTTGRPASRVNAPSTSSSARAQLNWERMTVRLLQRDNELVQDEIREYQQRYIENRSRFMDEVLHFHQQDMSRVPLSRPSSGKLSSVDQQFLQSRSAVGSDGRNEKRQLYRAKSALTRRPKAQRDVVEQAEVKLRDLFVDSSTPAVLSPRMPTADASLGGTREKDAVLYKRVRQDYDSPKRYVQGNLFDAEQLVTRKPRPMSAAMLRERDHQRARPKSAVTFNPDSSSVSATVDRPLKYETTRPVSGKKSALQSRTRKSSTSSTPPLNITNANTSSIRVEGMENLNDSISEQVPPFAEELGEEGIDPAASRPPISVRVMNAITRPECVDKFGNDLRQMEEMEEMFKANTLALQKKLGLPENGMV